MPPIKPKVFICVVEPGNERKALLILPPRGATHVADFVFRFRHTHQPFIKPANDVLQTFDTMPWLTRARQFVRLVREADHDGRNLPVLERAKHLFAA